MTKVRTKLDHEKLIKKQQAEGEEYLDQITKGGETGEAKAAKIIIEKGREAEKATNEDKARKIEELEKSRQWQKKDYILKLASQMSEMAKQMDLPMGYWYWISYGEDKLKIEIHSSDGRAFGRGIKPTGMTTYDFHAMGVLLTQAENTIDQIESRGAFKKDIIL